MTGVQTCALPIYYQQDALAIARAVAALRQYGVQARHLRAIKAAVEREVSLVEQIVAPQLRQRGPDARDSATRTAWQIADLTLRLHLTLMESALDEAGLASDSLRLGSYEPTEPHQPSTSSAGDVGAGLEPPGLRPVSGA